MKPLEIPQLADEVFDRLKSLADSRGVDVVREAIDCLERGLREREEIEKKLTRLRALREKMPNAWLTEEFVLEAKNEGRL